MKSDLEKAKEIINKYYKEGRFGLFDTRNIVNDPMETIYKDENIQIDICKRYEYFEVFGLSEDDFNVLCKFYSYLREDLPIC